MEVRCLTALTIPLGYLEFLYEERATCARAIALSIKRCLWLDIYIESNFILGEGVLL